jgi:hypothetical protein
MVYGVLYLWNVENHKHKKYACVFEVVLDHLAKKKKKKEGKN